MRNEEPKESLDPAFVPETATDEEKIREGWMLLLNKLDFFADLKEWVLASKSDRAAGVSDAFLSNG